MNLRGVLEMAVVAGLAVGWGASSATAKDKPEQVQKASELVIETLQREAREGVSDRRELLQSALEAAPDHPPARWHSGYVYEARERAWKTVDETISRGGNDKALAEYRQQRAQAADTIPGQLELASWCSARKLDDQARAHLTRVLDFNPDHVEARRLLGFVLINGTWVSQQEIAEAWARAREAAIRTAKWSPRLQDLRASLLRGGRPQARAALLEIRDPEACGAIDAVFLSAGGPLAAMGIEMLIQIRAPEAAATLAWHAVFSPSGHIQEAAARALMHQDKHDYVPLMLATMRSPIQSRWQVYERGPQLFYRHMFYAEAADHRDLAVVDESFQHVFLQNNRFATANGPEFNRVYQAEIRQDTQRREAAMDVARLSSSLRAMEREMAVRQHNQAVGQWNGQLCWALSEATGDFRAATPEQWWKWWYDYNEVVYDDQLPLHVYYQSQQFAQTSVRAAPTPHSCLAAGTPIWTEFGPVPVQDVRVGDRVFACDPETGALDLKPVVRTTARPKADVLRIHVGEDTLTATAGHVFWVSGLGWKKTADLQPERRLHTIQGTVDVDSVEPAGEEPVFNLVVADAHTYFVGQAKILTHDITIRTSTTCVVPGLTRLVADTADFFQ
jgi:hypothetical protein